LSRGPVLAVAACEKGRGGGHLVRCMALVRALRARGRDAWLFLPGQNSLTASLTASLAAAQFDPAWLIGEADLQGREWECIVLDRFRTSPEEFKRWTALAPVIGIDEGGPCRSHFDFLIDILPNIARTKPNIADPSLKNEKLEIRNEEWGSKLDNISGYRYVQTTNNNPDTRFPAPDSHIKVLISFGQEDAAELGIAVAQALAKKNNGSLQITILQGKLTKNITNNSSFLIPHSSLAETIPNLSEHLNEYDLIITHYGLTSFEALYAGVPVMLVSPGKYHEKLAKAAGFFSSGVGKRAAAKLAALLFKNGGVNCSFLNDLKNRCAALAVRHKMAPPAAGSPLVAGNPTRQSLAELVDCFAPNVSRNCPACSAAYGTGSLRAIARFSERTYRRCKNCGVIVMDRINPPPIEYDREYFFESYKKQYGKTYIEDFPHLTAMAKRRLAVIKSLLPGGGETCRFAVQKRRASRHRRG
jgi:spore coat polysaccharide biosynthesis predicted glycosyltransferase SpsG